MKELKKKMQLPNWNRIHDFGGSIELYDVPIDCPSDEEVEQVIIPSLGWDEILENNPHLHFRINHFNETVQLHEKGNPYNPNITHEEWDPRYSMFSAMKVLWHVNTMHGVDIVPGKKDCWDMCFTDHKTKNIIWFRIPFDGTELNIKDKNFCHAVMNYAVYMMEVAVP